MRLLAFRKRLNNNDAERSIRKFCVGKHSWHLVDSKRGAEASAKLYSIAETVRANSLKPFEYFRHILTELSKYDNDPTKRPVEDLLPWSESLPAECRVAVKD